MPERVAQPPIDLPSRDPEHHDFWPGFVVAVIGLIVMFCGARHLTGVNTVAGSTAWEFQLIKAFSSGGLEYYDPAPPPDPATLNDPAAAAAAFAQMERNLGKDISMKLRVNTGARTPCPT